MKKRIMKFAIFTAISATVVGIPLRAPQEKAATPVMTVIPETTRRTTEPAQTVEPTAEPTEAPAYMLDSRNQESPFNLCPVDFSEQPDGFAYTTDAKELPYLVQAYIYSVCKKYHVRNDVVIAMIKRESDFQWDAMGDQGRSYGYLQIMKMYHIDRMDKLGVGNLLNPYCNILVGVDYLAELLEMYNGDYTRALMAYNMGPSKANELAESGVATTEYTRTVLGGI